MPSYDYYCESNDQRIEVRHGMNEVVTTWGELCHLAGIEPGPTDRSAKVKKLANGGQPVKSQNLGSKAPCGSASGCGSGGCQFN